MNRDCALKLAATQNVIRNKFKKAYTNRLEKEDEVNNAIEPPKATAAVAAVTNFDSLNIATPIVSPSLAHLRQKNQSDPNALCDRLKILLAICQASIDSDGEDVQQIKNLIDELREQEIII